MQQSTSKGEAELSESPYQRIYQNASRRFKKGDIEGSQ